MILPGLEITQGEFADRPGVSRRTVSEILHGRRPITPDMAIRLGKLLSNGAGIWLRKQQALDVWKLEQEGDYSSICQLKAALDTAPLMRHIRGKAKPPSALISDSL